MDNISIAANALDLQPLPYQDQIRQYLKQEEPEIWEWYSSSRLQAEQADAVRFDLLKSTYRIDRETQPDLYAAADEAARKLALDAPVTIYQAQNPQGLNAALAYVPGEGHIVLHGPVSAQLSELEFRALLAHELSHLLLWQAWDGEFLIADQILSALTNDRHADTAHFASARLFGLYNEIFCDRGALVVTGDLDVVVAMLVKVTTGLDNVSAASFLRQAEEVFSTQTVKAADLTHPEAFIRARALRLWFESDPTAETEVRAMLEGRPALHELDLLGRKAAMDWTRRLLDLLLWPKWMQTNLVLSHARLFFEDYAPPGAPHDDPSLAQAIKTDDPHLNDYFCYVLLDFATADRDLEEYPLAAALATAKKLGLHARFGEIARKELRLRQKAWEKLDQQKEELLAKAHQQNSSR